MNRSQALKPSRRALLSAAASLAPIVAMSVTPFQSPAIASPGGNAALIAGAKLIADLAQKAKVALDHWSKCEQRFDEIRPQKPETLLWGLGSPVRYAQGLDYRKNGKTYLWCSTDDIEKCRHKTFFMYAFMGTGDPVSGERDDEFLETHWPVEGWERWVDKKRQKRFAKLLANYDAWIAADKAARVMSGLDAADDVLADADNAVWQVYDQMLEITPTTLEGFRAMATACALAFALEGKISPSTFGIEMVTKIMSALTGLPIVQDEEDA
jgi:hypothetical protein